MKLRRSMLFVPGANAAMVSTSFIYQPDTIMFDLEDSVALSEKDTARMLVAHALQHPLYREMETLVRVNPLSTEFGLKDLNAAVRGGASGIRLPKTDSPQDITDMETEIEKIERACGCEVGSTLMLAAIESAQGILAANDIAKSSKRLIGIALGAEDYVRAMKTERSPDGIELYFARASILHVARANNLMAFDTVYSDARNTEGFLHEASIIKQMGFDGKSLVNPAQIPLIHNLFAPTQKEVEQAKRIIKAAEDAAAAGIGVVSLNGKMVDTPIIERSRLILQRAEQSGIREE